MNNEKKEELLKLLPPERREMARQCMTDAEEAQKRRIEEGLRQDPRGTGKEQKSPEQKTVEDRYYEFMGTMFPPDSFIPKPRLDSEVLAQEAHKAAFPPDLKRVEPPPWYVSCVHHYVAQEGEVWRCEHCKKEITAAETCPGGNPQGHRPSDRCDGLTRCSDCAVVLGSHRRNESPAFPVNVKPSAGLSTPEPAPMTNNNPAVWDLVVEDMKERDQEGRRKYGTPLQPFNGRKTLRDAYQEALDLAVYLRSLIFEQEGK